ncbi:protein LONG AFTER FAR-RED 3-like [Humulus lupulus]|uniref:protein LONG AFTER FAR-RED 3-like n=1 Tax=Humulus lupulus TaxID=3486 RepID=UPI002B401E93|nr:protein LONG AFTER FAR-RED 3-like [Humulus lupulus]
MPIIIVFCSFCIGSCVVTVAIHAIGDRANDRILDMYESIISKNGIRYRRFRIVHAHHLLPMTADQFGELGIIASVQPEHLLYDFESATKKLGLDRARKGSYLFGSLLSGNATLAFGLDWPAFVSFVQHNFMLNNEVIASKALALEARDAHLKLKDELKVAKLEVASRDAAIQKISEL